MQELTSRGIRATSTDDLLRGAFETIFGSMPFDVAVAVLIEQHLELYICTRRGSEPLVGDAFIGRLRKTLEMLIPVSFESTDIVVKAEWHELPGRDESTPDAGTESEIHSLLKVDRRIAGVVMLTRAAEFDEGERQLLEIFSTQMSLLLGNLASRQRILSLAETDDLTGIWNKRYLRRQLPHEVERARVYGLPLSMLIFDVDDFKLINDSLGHMMGDVVLSELCGAVRETLRPPDLFARFGGDEFALVLPHTDLEGACAVAERILERVQQLVIPVDDQVIHCGISIGVASFEPGDTSASDLMRRADERLYAAKREGKNRFVAITPTDISVEE